MGIFFAEINGAVCLFHFNSTDIIFAFCKYNRILSACAYRIEIFKRTDEFGHIGNVGDNCRQTGRKRTDGNHKQSHQETKRVIHAESLLFAVEILHTIAHYKQSYHLIAQNKTTLLRKEQRL